MSEFTPGPWKLIPFGGPQIGNPATGEAICTMWQTDCMEANARLIAAAPELLSAAKLVSDEAGQLDAHGQVPVLISYDTIMGLRAAIAAATGEG